MADEIGSKRNIPIPQIQVDDRLTQEQTQLRNRLEKIYGLTTDLICIAGVDGYFKDINPAFEKLLGFTRAEILAAPFINLVHPDDRTATLEVFAGLMAGQDTADFENRYQCKNGGWKWLSWNANCDLRKKLIFGVAHDLTEQKKVEEALIEKHATLLGIIENTQAIIFTIDRAYCYTSYSRRHGAVMQAIYGVDIKIGQNLLDCMTVAVDRQEAKRNIDRALMGEQFVESAYSGDNARSRLYFEVSHNPIRMEDGRVIGVSVFSNDVTERKRAEEKIADLVRFSGGNPNPVAQIDSDGNIIYANEACNPLLKAWNCQVGGKLPDQIRLDVRTVFEEGNNLDQEITISDQTFSILWVPIAGANYINVYGKDITKRKLLAEEALRQANTYNRSLIEASLDPLVTITPDGKVGDVNAATEAVTGYSHKELIGTDFHSYFTDPDKARAGYEQVFEKGAVRDYELEIRHENGRITPVLYNASVYKDASGRVIGVFAAARDITQRKQAEEALSRLADRLAVINRLDHVISSSLDVSAVYDAFVIEMKELVEFDRTSIILIDDACENWQITRQWTKGKPAFQPVKWFPIKGTAFGWVVQHRRAYLEEILGEKTEWAEHQGLRQEGIHSRVLLPLITQGKVNGLLTLASCLSNAYQQSELELLQTLADQLAIAVQNSHLYELARLTAEDLEKRVQARTAQLERANKDLESFSYSVSHDLRAPLRAINGFAQILARRHKENLNEEGQHYLENVLEASNRMGILIDDLLQYSRIGRASIHRQTVSLDDLLVQILRDLFPRISETLAVVELPPAGSMPQILSDPTILGQIFTNIIDNALTYHKLGLPPEVRVTYQTEGDRYLFAVTDNGIGIPSEYLEKIFNVFQRLHSAEEYPGTGIGLAIVKKSAELLNGQVWAESTEGVGSTFWVCIPKEK